MDIEEAVEKATTFLLKSGYPTYKLILVNLDNSKKAWITKFDVGAFLSEYITIVIDNENGRIVSYERT